MIMYAWVRTGNYGYISEFIRIYRDVCVCIVDACTYVGCIRVYNDISGLKGITSYAAVHRSA